jgi:hypothetical protein
MTEAIDISWHFFGLHSLGLAEVEDQLQTRAFDEFQGNFAFLDVGISSLASAMQLEETTEYVKLALDYFIAAKDEDLPRSLKPSGLVLGELVGNAELTGLADDALHQLARHVRRKLFPGVAEMTTSDERVALARVRLTNQDLRDWMYHLVFPSDPPLTKDQCSDPQTTFITRWTHQLRRQKAAGGPHWPQVPIVFPPLTRAR